MVFASVSEIKVQYLLDINPILNEVKDLNKNNPHSAGISDDMPFFFISSS